MTRRQPALPAAARLLGDVAHDLAQPAAAASLAVEVALIELGRARPAAAAQRLEAATRELGVLQRRLRALGQASAGRLPADQPPGERPDIAALLHATIPGAAGPKDGLHVTIPADLLHEALKRLAVALRADPLRCRVSQDQQAGAILVEIAGPLPPGGTSATWLAALRAAGASATLRRVPRGTRVRIRLPGHPPPQG